jgi:hypothetical protein
MRFVKFTVRAALVAAGFAFISVAMAADAELRVERQGAVAFVSGGIGEDELEQIKKLRPDYPLELLFVTKGEPNQYLAGVAVQVKDNNGKIVLDATSEGPFLLVKMAPGKYSVSADHEGAVKQRMIRVAGGKTQRIAFVWDQ